jgi:bloom syndrome protein
MPAPARAYALPFDSGGFTISGVSGVHPAPSILPQLQLQRGGAAGSGAGSGSGAGAGAGMRAGARARVGVGLCGPDDDEILSGLAPSPCPEHEVFDDVDDSSREPQPYAAAASSSSSSSAAAAAAAAFSADAELVGFIDEADDVSSSTAEAMIEASRDPRHAQLWARAKSLNRSVFGHGEFRGRQGVTVAAALMGQDVFVLMPTGGGKSLCYQLTALTTGGLTVVVCPLVALMHDQVEQLQMAGIRAGFLSSENNTDNQKYLGLMSPRRNAAGGHDVELKLVYVTPERLRVDERLWSTMQYLEKLKLLDRFVVDEAHW